LLPASLRIPTIAKTGNTQKPVKNVLAHALLACRDQCRDPNMQVTSGISPYSYPAGTTTSAAGATKASATVNGALQTGGSDASGDNSVVQDFLNYAKMNPFERMRASILKSMNLTEADLEKMPPQQRDAVEQKIRDVIQKKLEAKGSQGGQAGSLVDVSA
jgi:hypothetical protein